MTTIRIAFAVAALASGLSGMAVAHTTKAPSHSTAVQTEAFDRTASAPMNTSNDNDAYRYHGGPKSND